LQTSSLSRSALAWVLARALRLAIASCVVGLLLATTLSGDAAERFATAGYLAAIFAAFALALGRFFPLATAEDRRSRSAPFPIFLAYSIGVVLFLSVAAVLVSQAGAEVLALVVAVALIVTTVLVRCGTVAAFNAALVRGGFFVACCRYAVLIGVLALALAALMGTDGETVVSVAYRFMVFAALCIAVSLIARTKAGIWAQERYVETIAHLDRLSEAFVFERTAAYAATAAVLAMIVASLLPSMVSGPFAAIAYAAAVAAAFSVAMECRRLRS
jgi:hypothetical protein